MGISLSPTTQKLIEERMKDGDFQSPDELIRIALKSLEGEPVEELDPETQAAIERAEDQADRGEGIPLDEAFRQLRQKYTAL